MKLVLDGRTKAGKAAKLKAAQEKMFGIGVIDEQRVRAIVDFEAALDAPREKQVGGDRYVRMDIQPWVAMEAWMTPEQYAGFLRGNALKYLARCDAKGGLDDIRKAHHYLTELIEFSER